MSCSSFSVCCNGSHVVGLTLKLWPTGDANYLPRMSCLLLVAFFAEIERFWLMCEISALGYNLCCLNAQQMPHTS